LPVRSGTWYALGQRCLSNSHSRATCGAFRERTRRALRPALAPRWTAKGATVPAANAQGRVNKTRNTERTGMADRAQPALQAVFRRPSSGGRVRSSTPYGDRIDAVSGAIVTRYGQLERPMMRPQSAPAWKPPAERRHRAFAAPPGGRASLQEHLNIWGTSVSKYYPTSATAGRRPQPHALLCPTHHTHPPSFGASCSLLATRYRPRVHADLLQHALPHHVPTMCAPPPPTIIVD